MENNGKFQSARTFGVEIEFHTPLFANDLATKLTEMGLKTVFAGYTKEVMCHWKIVTDSSVEAGYELVSPILSGQDGLDEVARALDALVALGATVSISTGLHVHVDAQDFRSYDFADLMGVYAFNTPTIDRMTASHRRNCYYAAHVGYYLGMAQQWRTCEFPSQALRRYEPPRNLAVNVSAFLVHGTVEFRQHEGCLDSVKVRNWIQFCVNLVDMVKNAPKNTTEMQVPVATPFMPDNIRKLLELLKEGTTVGNIYAASVLGISSQSIPAYISAIRARHPSLKIRTIRNRGYLCVNYWEIERILNPTRTVTVNAPIDYNIDIFAGLPQSVRDSYLGNSSEAA